MKCPGHFTSGGCFMMAQENSFWGLCISCERIENRLFLEAVQKAIREDHTDFEFHGNNYSLQDPTFSDRFMKHVRFLSSPKDPRLSLLTICFSKHPQLFGKLTDLLANDASFITSANLLYRSHLPSRSVCGALYKIQKKFRQHFLDMPSCPSCMARYLLHFKGKDIHQRHISHILSIFRNRVLSQHPTWFVSIFKLLQTIWEQDLEDQISFPILNDILIRQNPVEFQIEFRDWMGAFVETPVVIEKMLSGKISNDNRDFLQLWTGQPINMPFIKRLQRARMAAWEEDLIIKTWHPSRLMTWCFDIEELKDFD